MTETRLSLPMPPPSNNLFPTGRGGKRFKSPEYRAWLTAAGWEVKAQRPACHKGKVKVRYVFARPLTSTGKPRKADVANREKGVSDLLVSLKIIEDDSLIEEMTLLWSDELPPGRAEVLIRPW